MKLTPIYNSLCIFLCNTFIGKEKYHELQIHHFNSNHLYCYLVTVIDIVENLKNVIWQFSAGFIDFHVVVGYLLLISDLVHIAYSGLVPTPAKSGLGLAILRTWNSAYMTADVCAWLLYLSTDGLNVYVKVSALGFFCLIFLVIMLLL